jgi:hypothetical protein
MIDGFPLSFFLPLVVHALAGLTTGAIGSLLRWPGWVHPARRRGNASDIAPFGIPKRSCRLAWLVRARGSSLSIRRTVFDLFFKEAV